MLVLSISNSQLHAQSKDKVSFMSPQEDQKSNCRKDSTFEKKVKERNADNFQLVETIYATPTRNCCRIRREQMRQSIKSNKIELKEGKFGTKKD